MDDIAGVKFPLQRARGSIQSVYIPVATSEINCAMPQRRRRQVEVEGIGHGFGRRFRSVQMFALEPFFTLGLKFPFQFSASRVDGIEPAAITAEIYGTTFDRRRRGHANPSEELPLLRSGFKIYGV